nr:nucleotide sugar dehydrogenase [Lachnospiraceae bacterium]
YYLTYKAEMEGYHSQVIMAGRRVNDDMGKYVAEMCVKNLIKTGKNVREAKVAIFGFTFKEDCPDTRNTRVIDIVDELKEYGIEPMVSDPIADAEEAEKLYNMRFKSPHEIEDVDAIIIAVAHDCFRSFTKLDMDRFFGNRISGKVIMDLKGILNRKDYSANEYVLWRL